MMLHVSKVLKVHKETYVELDLDETGTRHAQLFADGSVIVQGSDGVCIDLNSVQAMHLANAIIAQSQQSENR
jgi:hypothetical protein